MGLTFQELELDWVQRDEVCSTDDEIGRCCRCLFVLHRLLMAEDILMPPAASTNRLCRGRARCLGVGRICRILTLAMPNQCNQNVCVEAIRPDTNIKLQ